MGLFSKPKPEPVRNDQVRKLIKLGMAETDAKGAAQFTKAQKAFRDAAKSSSQAEMNKACLALFRHGY